MDERVFVAGHRGMVGSALVRALNRRGNVQLILRSRAELDLCDGAQVRAFMQAERPDTVILAAARVGGIQANLDAPADFVFQNLQIQNNVIDSAARAGIQRLCFLGSSCIYPRLAAQPMSEEALLTGPLEPTNAGYAIAKIAGLTMAKAYQQQYGMKAICPMPCNLYGPGDCFDLQKSHVLSALVRRFFDAHESQVPVVTLWGTGSAYREFMHVDDLAEAVLFIMDRWHSPEIINVGTGEDISIRNLAEMIAGLCGYTGAIEWDSTKPDGMPRKLMDVTKLTELGYRSRIPLEAGVREMIASYSVFKHSVDKQKDKVNDSFDEKHVSQGTGNPPSSLSVHSGSSAA
jgi:GDP-L-fucose synthase